MTVLATEVYAPAKINLALAITEKRTDGYHGLETLFQSISLFDRLGIKLKDQGISCKCGVLSGEKNLAYKAAQIFMDHPGVNHFLGGQTGVEITIEKNIPLEAGLAGGSSDAAAVLRALNQLCSNPFPYEVLLEMAKICGSDTAFCLKGGTQWGEGTGTDLKSLPVAPEMDLILVKPPQGVSTARAYQRFDEIGEMSSLDKNLWLKLLKEKDVQGIGKNLSNSLEKAVDGLLPEILQIKELLIAGGCHGALMSGSGSAVFGILKDKKQGETIAEKLRDYGYRDIWLVRTIDSSDIWNNKE